MIDKLYGYDLETYPNCFLFGGSFLNDDRIFQYEISDRKNELSQLLQHLNDLRTQNISMFGFNNVNFDDPIIEDLLQNPHGFTAARANQLGTKIIQTQGKGFTSVYHAHRLIPQIDLFKINHFDNKAKATSLKALQFAMRSESVEDLPFSVRPLTFEEMQILADYNIHDLLETKKFCNLNLHLIQMRQELLDSGTLSGDVLNYSDVKIGTEYLIKKIGEEKCYDIRIDHVTGKKSKKPKQTFREFVKFSDIILPHVSFRTEEFNAVFEWFKSQTLFITSEDERPSLSTTLSGIPFDFGVGGVHASVSNSVFEASEEFEICDVDVSGMYVAVAIANGFYPEHLGQDFIKAYRKLQADRKLHAKETSMNKVLKLAGNGVYGNSNNPYSPFYDPKYTFTVTVNGQLQLIQLVELLSMIPKVQLIQANTDGITALVPRISKWMFDYWCAEWEKLTGLKLEHVNYKKMWIRDVNNYVALGVDGKIKRKGAYWYPETVKDYEGVWNKDFSAMVEQKAASQVLINGWNPDAVVRCVTDPFDFMLRYKTPRESTVYIGDQPQSKTVRYYVSKTGQPMKKLSKPKGEIGDYKRKNGLTDSEFNKIKATVPKGSWDPRIHTQNKSKYEQVETSIEAGYMVKNCNKASDFDFNDVDYDYYVERVRKLIIGEKQ